MTRRRQAVRLGIPALIVAALAAIALWRVNVPLPEQTETTSGEAPAARREAEPVLTRFADLLANNSVGREASLEAVEVREVISPRTFWAGPTDAERLFVVLDPDVKRDPGAEVTSGIRLTLIGLVRPAPTADAALADWDVDLATAQALVERGTYLHATEIRVVR